MGKIHIRGWEIVMFVEGMKSLNSSLGTVTEVILLSESTVLWLPAVCHDHSLLGSFQACQAEMIRWTLVSLTFQKVMHFPQETSTPDPSPKANPKL